MGSASRELLEALQKDLSTATDVIFALRLAVEDDVPADLLSESSELLARLVAHREAVRRILET